jgi:hypothetical protein
VGFTLIFSGVGVLPEDADTSSHAALKGLPETATVKFAPAGVDCTCMVWATGSFVLPIWKAN